jgi:DNA-binding MarR family transcriptional regulator
MDDRERLVELVASMQRDLVPSLLRLHEEDDLQLLHGAILQVLDRGASPTVKELAALIHRSVSRTSRIVDQLVRRGLVERHEDGADRRARRLRLSGEGKARVERIRAVRVESQLRLWDHLTAEERATVMHAMELYALAARRMRDERDRTE